MSPAKGLSRLGHLYIWGVVLCGLSVIHLSAYEIYRHPVPNEWFLLAALTLISGSATVNLPSVPASISISETFVFTAVLLYGPAAGTVIVALDGLVISFWIARRRREWHRALFNTSAPALSAWCSARLFFFTAGITPLVAEPSGLDRILVPLVLFATTYFGLNSWLITFAVTAETRLAPLQVWRDNFPWLSLNYFCGASVAFLLVTYTRHVDIRYIGVIIPLLLVLYFTFKTSIARVEDANKHVAEVNQLYLSTIETLAMAIDAKDQITHGHIRRVQSYAVGLAHHIGITDNRLLKAIEAAALLHDMGKLAVPEYILNKPGALTPAEFEKMKLHASVGADILSAVDFPYPVVPIVRHHHEYWNGKGYPDGLKGTDIPIGARILAVVDCFDALTSDRPYRPGLSDAEALGIVTERRGSMYDPLVVDAFIAVYNQLALPDTAAGPQHAIEKIAASRRHKPPDSTIHLNGIAASTDESLTMYALASSLAAQQSLDDVGDVITNHLRRLIPFTSVVVYVYNSDSDSLEAQYVAGDTKLAIRGLRIPLGQRLSGWVAANQKTILNSDPVLDLGEVARAITPPLRYCISTPLVLDAQLIGVLTLYASETDTFTEEHRRLIEVTARSATVAINRCSSSDIATRMQALRRSHKEVGPQNADPALQSSQGYVVLVLRISSFHDISLRYGRNAGAIAVRHVTDHARPLLSPATVFRYSDDELVTVLSTQDASSATELAHRICERIRCNPLVLPSEPVPIQIALEIVVAPSNGSSLQDLVSAARTKLSSTTTEIGSRVH